MSDKSPIDEGRLKELLLKYYSMNIVDTEVQELAGFCRQMPEIRLLLQRLDDKELVQEHIAHLKAAETEKNWEVLRARLQAAPEREKAKRSVVKWSRRSLRRSLKVAAVVVAVIIIGVFMLVRKSATEKNTPLITSHKGLTPGHEKAVLILEDGEQIELDSTTIGEIINLERITFKQTGVSHLEVVQEAGVMNQGKGKPDSLRYNTLQTPRGGQFSITLPEGTEVSLNNESTLRVPVSFSRTERWVYLDGEAYFEVAKNVQLPFSVNSMVDGREQTVHVLGTSFNIRAYSNEVSMRTTLETGKVQVTSGNHLVYLEPDEQAVIAGNRVDHRKGIKLDAVLAWKKGIFNFVGDSLPGVLRQITRWYNKEVVIRGLLRPHTFESILSRNSSLPDLLSDLSHSSTIFHYTLEGDTIYINQ